MQYSENIATIITADVLTLLQSGQEAAILMEPNASFDRLTVSLSSLLNVNLSFGLKAGINVFNVDYSKGLFLESSDPILSNNIQNNTTLSLGVGAYMYSDNWYLGFSVPDFIANDFYNDVEQSVYK